MLGQQMRDLLEVFPRDQVHWIFFDDFKSDTAGEYRRALAFLGLPDDRRDVFQRVNQNAMVQPGPLLRLLKGNRPLRRISGQFKRIFGVSSLGDRQASPET